MKMHLAGMALVGALLLPSTAEASFNLELSLGSGFGFGDSVIDDVDRIPTNLMVTPSYQLLGFLQLQVGVLAELGDIEGRDFDLQFRPQIKLDLPVIPIYGRVIFSITNLLNDGDTEFLYGGGLGFEIPLPLLSPFIEGAILPSSIDGFTIFEARIGAALF